MAVLQAYQANLLKELDEGKELKTKDIQELHQAADLQTVCCREFHKL